MSSSWASYLDQAPASHIDISGAQELRELIDDLADSGITFVIARLKSPIEQQLPALGLAEALGPDHVFPTVRSAILAVTGVDLEAASA